MPNKEVKIITMGNTNNKQLVVKSNQLIESSYKLTTQEQRIILLMSSMIKSEDEDFQTYRINISDFIKLMEIKGHSKYKEIKEITKKLLERVLVIKDPVAKTELQASWLSSVKYFDGKGYIQLRFDPELKPYLLKLKEFFTKYQLKNIIQLKRSYSIRIYELLKQYEKIGERAFNLEKLKKVLGIKPDKYKLYGHFKEKILKPAQKELKQQTDIRFEFKEKKAGRKVEGLIFLIQSNKKGQKKQDVSDELLVLKTANKELYQKLQSYFCLSSDQAEKVLKEYSKDPERILDNIAYVEKKYQKREVENIGAYTLKAIQENYSSQPSMFDIEKQRKEEQKREKEAQERRIEQLKEGYDKYYRQEAKKVKEGLSGAKLEALDSEVWAAVKEKYRENSFGLKAFHRINLTDRLAKIAGVLDFEEWKEQEVKKAKQ